MIFFLKRFQKFFKRCILLVPLTSLSHPSPATRYRGNSCAIGEQRPFRLPPLSRSLDAIIRLRCISRTKSRCQYPSGTSFPHLQVCRTTITLRFRKEFAHILRLICLALFPAAGLDDGRVRRNPFHDIHPAGVRDAIGECRLDELPVVESEVFFETVHTLPVLQRIFDELGKVKNSTKKRGSGAERPKFQRDQEIVGWFRAPDHAAPPRSMSAYHPA